MTRPATGGETLSFDFLEGVHTLDGRELSERSWVETHQDRGWTVNHSSLADYSRRAFLLGHPDSLTGIIEAQIGNKSDNAGLDLAAGTGAAALSDLLAKGTLSKALATNFGEGETAEVKLGSNLDEIRGDLLDEDTWQGIVDWKELNAPGGFR